MSLKLYRFEKLLPAVKLVAFCDVYKKDILL